MCSAIAARITSDTGRASTCEHSVNHASDLFSFSWDVSGVRDDGETCGCQVV
jgi:hypothetical protein